MSTGNKVMLQITKGLQSIPLIGGFIPDYKTDMISASEIQKMIEYAYNNLNKLSSEERSKLNRLTNQLEDYGQIIGSPALVQFARSKMNQVRSQISDVERKISNIDNRKELVSNRANDLINAEGTSDRFKDSDLVKSFEQSVSDTSKLT